MRCILLPSTGPEQLKDREYLGTVGAISFECWLCCRDVWGQSATSSGTFTLQEQNLTSFVVFTSQKAALIMLYGETRTEALKNGKELPYFTGRGGYHFVRVEIKWKCSSMYGIVFIFLVFVLVAAAQLHGLCISFTHLNLVTPFTVWNDFIPVDRTAHKPLLYGNFDHHFETTLTVDCARRIFSLSDWRWITNASDDRETAFSR